MKVRQYVSCSNCTFCEKRFKGFYREEFEGGTCIKSPPVIASFKEQSQHTEYVWLQPEVQKHSGCYEGEVDD